MVERGLRCDRSFSGSCIICTAAGATHEIRHGFGIDDAGQAASWRFTFEEHAGEKSVLTSLPCTRPCCGCVSYGYLVFVCASVRLLF